MNGTLYDANKYETVLYRVPIANCGGYSPKVAVRLMATSPEIPGGRPVKTLHHTGDNPDDKASYERAFPMGENDVQWVDVVAVTRNSRSMKCFIYDVSCHDSVLEIQLDGQYVFTLMAIADKSSPPTKYRVDVDVANGLLSMTKM